LMLWNYLPITYKVFPYGHIVTYIIYLVRNMQEQIDI
jgi:hypothetical protein